MEIIAIFIGVGVVVLFIVVLGRLMDDGRVRRHIEKEGGVLLEKHWNPFGKGWFGEQNARIYDVRYRDRDGNTHKATCKTSALAGVYFTDDHIVDQAHNSRDALLEENRRLRLEIERLKRGKNE
jgi:hypothetical protein